MPKKKAHKANEKPLVDTNIPSLGVPKCDNPLQYCRFVEPSARVLLNMTEDDLSSQDNFDSASVFELAGPREKVYFDPSKTKCAIVTCGGLCPGINDVIRAIVLEAFHSYNIAACLGIRFGLQGFIPKFGHDFVELTPDSVSRIHQFGGTFLGSSRGPQPAEDIVDALERMNVNILFMIGGDGTMKAAQGICEEIANRNLKISVIGIPKTIDNDISCISKSFGFDTAVEKATEAIRCAHIEATGAYNGIGLVKVMGRHSGFIAAQSVLALREANFVLVPEYEFDLDGERGLLPALESRLRDRHHAVIVLAEGAGQHLCPPTEERDASGNLKLADISTVLIRSIMAHFKAREMPVTLKYIDPSYIIRSVPANSNDRVYCGFLGQSAVHAGMCGKTGMVISRLQDRYLHLPLPLVTQKRKHLNIQSGYWRAVLESTGQNHITPNNHGPHPGACELPSPPAK